jgi:hypothetical protein
VDQGLSVESVKLEDRVETRRPPQTPELDPLLCTWINTNRASQGIVSLRLAARNGRLAIDRVSAGGTLPRDWGEFTADAVYSDRLDSGKIVAFTARRDFDGMTARLQANVSLGLLIVAVFYVVSDGIGRANFYAREFYRRAEPHPEEHSDS